MKEWLRRDVSIYSNTDLSRYNRTFNVPGLQLWSLNWNANGDGQWYFEYHMQPSSSTCL